MHDVLGTWEGPLRVFVEDVLGSDDFGPVGFCRTIGWAQYRRLIPVAQAGWKTTGLRRFVHKLCWSLLPRRANDPVRWAATVALP